jgi:hypothetical protein
LIGKEPGEKLLRAPKPLAAALFDVHKSQPFGSEIFDALNMRISSLRPAWQLENEETGPFRRYSDQTVVVTTSLVDPDQFHPDTGQWPRSARTARAAIRFLVKTNSRPAPDNTPVAGSGTSAAVQLSTAKPFPPETA